MRGLATRAWQEPRPRRKSKGWRDFGGEASPYFASAGSQGRDNVGALA